MRALKQILNTKPKNSKFFEYFINRYGEAATRDATEEEINAAEDFGYTLFTNIDEFKAFIEMNYGRRNRDRISAYLENLKAGCNEEGEPELVFRDADTAADFAFGALEMGKIYVSDEDRFAMEALAELLKDAVESKVIAMEDLWLTEAAVIRKLNLDHCFRDRWNCFRGYYQIRRGTGTVIHAKKRYIDPLVENEGRVTEIRGDFRTAVDAFLAEPQDEPVSGLSRAAIL